MPIENKTQLTDEEKLEILTKKVFEIFTEIIGREIPDTGHFDAIRYGFDIPGTQNKAGITAVHSAMATPRQRTLRLEVIRADTDRQYSVDILKGTNDVLKEYLAAEGSVQEVIGHIKWLSGEADNYWGV